MASVFPSFDDFSALAGGDVTHVPVARSLLADTLTPVGALGKTICREDYFTVRKAVLGSQAPKVLDAKAAQK